MNFRQHPDSMRFRLSPCVAEPSIIAVFGAELQRLNRRNAA